MPSSPVRLRLSRAKGARLPEGAVNVARPGPWGNPFVVGKHGDQARCVELHHRLMAGFIALTTPAHMAEQQKAYTHARLNVGSIRGRPLACWCPPDQPCHGDTLLRLANTPTQEPPDAQ